MPKALPSLPVRAFLVYAFLVLALGARAALPYPDYNTNPLPPDIVGVERTAPELARSFTLGWNMGNTLEATGGETSWGNPMITPPLIELIKDSGFDAIRLPVAWNSNNYANPQTAEIDSAWLDRVEQVVQMCVDEGLYVILNIHWDGGWLENNVTPDAQVAVNAKQKAFWEQIATRFRDFDERLLFASANEPNVDTQTQMDVLLTYHQTFVDAVRSTGGKNAYRVLVIQGPRTDIEKTYSLMDALPVDTVPNRLMAEIHFYTPYQFTLMNSDADWGKQFYYWGEGNHSTTDTAHNPTWGEEATVDHLFGLMKEQFVDEGIPVILGEISAMRRSNLTGENLTLHLASRDSYHEYTTRRALENGIIPFYWDNGGLGNHASGIFDRWNRTVFDQRTMDALLAGARSYYTANPDGDWANNLLESFLGSDPNDANSVPALPVVSLNSDYTVSLKIHRFSDQKLEVNFERSDAFENWTPYSVRLESESATSVEWISESPVSNTDQSFLRWAVAK